MAWHCANGGGQSSTPANYNQYIFYFHWERAGCENSTAPITYRTMTGCQKQAEIPLGGGSDGLLLRLNNTIPIEYDVYYNGWDATLVTSWPAGSAGIHHPSGDVKKFSLAPGVTSQTTANIQGYGQGASNGHWNCDYVTTVSESGSSGSPLFNNQGLVIGALTGGGGSCTITFT
jgi:hypothetical protein